MTITATELMYQRREALKAQIETLTAERDHLDAALNTVAQYEAEAEMRNRAEDAEDDEVVDKTIVADGARVAILEAGRPMKRGALKEALDRRGVVIGGKNPTNYLGTLMYRDSDFVNLEGFGYWVADKPFPPANYFPKQTELRIVGSNVIFDEDGADN